MTPPLKRTWSAIGSASWGRQAHALRTGLPSADIPASLAEAERLRQSPLADAGRGDLLKTIIDRVELRPNGLRMILSLVPLTPAAAPRTDCKVSSSPESFRCGSSAAGGDE